MPPLQHEAVVTPTLAFPFISLFFLLEVGAFFFYGSLRAGKAKSLRKPFQLSRTSDRETFPST